MLEKVFFDPTYLSEAYDHIGHERHLFSCAYTPEGFVDFTESILKGIRRVYYLEGGMGTGKSALMRKVASRAKETGLDVEIYHTPLIPDKIGTILIQSLNIAITSSEKFKHNHYECINLSEYLDQGLIASFDTEIAQDSKLLEGLLSKGIEQINKAKKEHDVLEQYYVPNMNFAAAGEKYEELMSRILDLAESKVSAASARFYN